MLSGEPTDRDINELKIKRSAVQSSQGEGATIWFIKVKSIKEADKLLKRFNGLSVTGRFSDEDSEIMRQSYLEQNNLDPLQREALRFLYPSFGSISQSLSWIVQVLQLLFSFISFLQVESSISS